MNKKQCSQCKQIKSLFEFNKSKHCKFGVRGECKKCRNKKNRKYQKKYNKLHPYYLKTYYKTISNKFDLNKKGTGCCICGYNKCSQALEFHHINPNKKEKHINPSDYFSKNPNTQKELKKCILVCANCHKELHELIIINLNKYNKTIKKICNTIKTSI